MAAEGEIEDFPSSRDLLRRFSGEETAPEVGGGELREVELSLGLSLGGCFGDAKEKGLVRSSSLSLFPPENHHHAAAGGIARTVSMPAETEEEWRRRKEMQYLKRMEAKRKRWEKRAKERKGEEEEEEEEEDLASAAAGPPPKEEKVAAAVPAATAAVGALRLAGTGKPASQGSIGSQGSSSSGVSDFESKPLLGLDATRLNISVEVRCPPIPLVLEHAGNSSTMLNKLTNPPKEEEDEPSKKRKIITARSSGVKEMERSMMEEMPCVSTRGDGPNGRRIEGFLYKYRKGEEVRIVCVCHGSFLTPAEFVKHAGGGDVDHPLRHIVVSPNPCGLL